jgi:hypothetical protein
MIHRTLKFPAWINPNGTVHERIITFYNDGQFTTNSETDHKVPQNEEVFNGCIDAYIQCGEAIELI